MAETPDPAAPEQQAPPKKTGFMQQKVFGIPAPVVAGGALIGGFLLVKFLKGRKAAAAGNAPTGGGTRTVTVTGGASDSVAQQAVTRASAAETAASAAESAAHDARTQEVADLAGTRRRETADEGDIRTLQDNVKYLSEEIQDIQEQAHSRQAPPKPPRTAPPAPETSEAASSNGTHEASVSNGKTPVEQPKSEAARSQAHITTPNVAVKSAERPPHQASPVGKPTPKTGAKK